MRKRKYYRKCGYCGKQLEQNDLIRTDIVDNGWLCRECFDMAVKAFKRDIVECKNCKWHIDNFMDATPPYMHEVCTLRNEYVAGDGYCHRGERRSE